MKIYISVTLVHYLLPQKTLSSWHWETAWLQFID